MIEWKAVEMNVQKCMKDRTASKCKINFDIKLHACKSASNKQKFYVTFKKYSVTMTCILFSCEIIYQKI